MKVKCSIASNIGYNQREGLLTALFLLVEEEMRRNVLKIFSLYIQVGVGMKQRESFILKKMVFNRLLRNSIEFY